MTSISRKQMRQLVTRPSAYMKFRATGRLPATVKPSSPLITLLESLPPQLRMQIRGVGINPSLGYMSGIQFHTAENLLRWLKPCEEMLVSDSWPAESCRIKHFQRRLTLSDLKPCCASWPDAKVWELFGVLLNN